MSGSSYERSGWITRKTGNVYGKKDFRNTFEQLQKEAQEEGGRYSGDINRAAGFQLCGVMTVKQYNQAQNWLLKVSYTNRKAATPKFLEEQGVERKWRGAYDEKDGAACAVVIKDNTQDTTLISGAFIKDKGIIPVKNRETKKYVVNYNGKWGSDNHRVSSVPDAWKWIKGELKKNPDFSVNSVVNSYTYAKPKIGQKTKKGRKVRVEFFGFADD